MEGRDRILVMAAPPWPNHGGAMPPAPYSTPMAAILSGAVGASCQMCTATHRRIDGVPINRTISDAIQLFGELEDIEYFVALTYNERTI